MRHVTHAQQFDRETMEYIFKTADSLEKRRQEALKGKIMATLFYEPSTRTRMSFESAMLKLGGSVISTENAKEFSSAIKGETLSDTIRVVSGYADVIVLRHFEKGAAEVASKVSEVPIVNAGDGPGQHPTQALLDLYTMRREIGKIDSLSVAFMGDLKNGRTVRSLSYLLGKFKNVKIYFVAPQGLSIGEDIKEYLRAEDVWFEERESIHDIIGEVDVVYQTRIQKERFASEEEYLKYKGVYILTLHEVSLMKIGAIIMHPLPRVDEILPEVDASPHAAYFRQAHYGVYVRMAILKYLFE